MRPGREAARAPRVFIAKLLSGGGAPGPGYLLLYIVYVCDIQGFLYFVYDQ